MHFSLFASFLQKTRFCVVVVAVTARTAAPAAAAAAVTTTATSLPHNYNNNIGDVSVCVISVSYSAYLCVFSSSFLAFCCFFTIFVDPIDQSRNEFANQRPYELDESCAMLASSGGSRSGNEHFDMQRKTILYIHGFADDSKYDSVRAIVDAYLQRSDYNILVLDWAELAGANYLIDAVPNAKQVTNNNILIVSIWSLEFRTRPLSLSPVCVSLHRFVEFFSTSNELWCPCYDK